ncbi:hypothetical protein [Terriglobus sp.]|uniref:hypothetical protein n=1 Tax=Terriglobus sp. TaxID=1889013 RepID=UPI003AFF78DD
MPATRRRGGWGTCRTWFATALLICGFACFRGVCFASAALLIEEPFGQFGAFNPTGHAAVYLNQVCADTPTHLRPCQPGEHGVVISRYHKINHLDWVAIPLVPYLYSVERMQDVPATMTPEQEVDLREAYWREHLQGLAPANPDESEPDGEWIQLIGSSYDRRIYGFQVETTPEQDERFIALYNDKRNVGHFNLFFHNCADFSRVVMDTYFPGAIHRNFVADVGLMTPKQAAKSLVKYSRKHPEVGMTKFLIEQVPGSLPRSHSVDGVEESLVRSKKYMVPLVILTPHIATAAVVGYLTRGRMRMPKDAPLLKISDDLPAPPVTAAEKVPAAQETPAMQKVTATVETPAASM